MNKMKKLIVCLCAIAALAGMDGNMAYAAGKNTLGTIKITGQDERGETTNLTLNQLKGTDAYKNMLPQYKELINEKNEYFGIVPPNHKDLVLVYRGPEYDIGIELLGELAYVWRSTATNEVVLNKPLPTPKPTTYFNPTAATVKKLTPAERDYVLAMRTALNDTFNYAYAAPFTILKKTDMEPKEASGKLVIVHKLHPIAGTLAAAGLSEMQVKAYDLFGGKPVAVPYSEPVKITHPYSPCAVMSVMRVNGEQVFGLNLTAKRFDAEDEILIQRKVFLLEKESKENILKGIRSGLERLPEEEMQSGTANSENLKQALTEMAQPATSVITILLDSKTFEKEDNEWVLIAPIRGGLEKVMPFKSMMQQAERLAKNETDGKKVSTRFISVKPSNEMSRAQ